MPYTAVVVIHVRVQAAFRSQEEPPRIVRHARGEKQVVSGDEVPLAFEEARAQRALIVRRFRRTRSAGAAAELVLAAGVVGETAANARVGLSLCFERVVLQDGPVGRLLDRE